ncbi:hypothetical protein [Nocardia anaemiae]|uniref:hypothetical protein n=1 Tax=Nocardia anaemiae TaxID=263910 RepID=UPI000AEA4DBA|nr:hypothetical protein [Nocardia anaemiae]
MRRDGLSPLNSGVVSAIALRTRPGQSFTSTRRHTVPRHRALVRFLGRLRLGGSALALVAAVLLVAPMFDCALAGEHSHAHASQAPAQSVIPLAADLHAAIHPPMCACSLHAGHCVLKSVLPKGIGQVPTLLLLTLAMVAALVAVAAATPAGLNVRGPPLLSVPAARGRVILTHLCIARR